MTAGSQARTNLARKAVLDAALRLFGDSGYAATRVEQIGAASGVPTATVYRLFPSKLAIMQALFNATLPPEAVAADGTPRLTPDHPRLGELICASDPRRQVAIFAGIARDILSRVAAVYPILVTAAGTDPSAARLLAAYTRTRAEGQANLARALAGRGALRPGLSEAAAADIVYALASPEAYRLLVADRGWSPQRYEQWLAAALASQLLAPAQEGRQP